MPKRSHASAFGSRGLLYRRARARIRNFVRRRVRRRRAFARTRSFNGRAAWARLVKNNEIKFLRANITQKWAPYQNCAKSAATMASFVLTPAPGQPAGVPPWFRQDLAVGPAVLAGDGNPTVLQILKPGDGFIDGATYIRGVTTFKIRVEHYVPLPSNVDGAVTESVNAGNIHRLPCDFRVLVVRRGLNNVKNDGTYHTAAETLFYRPGSGESGQTTIPSTSQFVAGFYKSTDTSQIFPHELLKLPVYRKFWDVCYDKRFTLSPMDSQPTHFPNAVPYLAGPGSSRYASRKDLKITIPHYKQYKISTADDVAADRGQWAVYIFSVPHGVPGNSQTQLEHPSGQIIPAFNFDRFGANPFWRLRGQVATSFVDTS